MRSKRVIKNHNRMKEEIQQFYKKLVKLIEDSYKPSIASNVSNTEQSEHEHIGALRGNLNFWLDSKETSVQLGGDTLDERKNKILERIRLTLESLTNFIKDSNIFSANEREGADSFYQNLMKILQVPIPDDLQPIIIIDDTDGADINGADIDGLFYREMVYSEAYWGAKGRSHITLMNKLSSLLKQLLTSHTDEKQKELFKIALGTVFTTDRRVYDKCAGAHDIDIQIAMMNLSAVSPEEKIHNYWKAYKLSLLIEGFGVEGKNITNRTREILQKHLPSAIDVVFDIDKNLINEKDEYAVYLPYAEFDIDTFAFLRDKLPDFHKFLYNSLSDELNYSLEGFDELTSDHKKEEQVTATMLTHVAPFFGKEDEVLKNVLLSKFYENDDYIGFNKSKDIISSLLDDLSTRITKILGIDEYSLKNIEGESLSKEQKNNLLKDLPLFNALKIIENNNDEGAELLTAFKGLEDDINKVNLIRHLAFYKPGQCVAILNALNETDRTVFVGLALDAILLKSDNYHNFDIVKESIPKKDFWLVFETLATEYAFARKEEALDMVMEGILVSDQKHKIKTKLCFEILENYIFKADSVSQSIVDLIVEKIPNNERKKGLKKIMYELTYSNLGEGDSIEGLRIIFNKLIELGPKVTFQKKKLLTTKQSILTENLLKDYHRSIKNLGTLIRGYL